jgi:uncharacterized membrane protein/predicted heme/steroid binding protein
MESLLYTIAGLPVHPLIVHFAVVILPLAALALIAIIYTPKLKNKYSFITVILIVLGSAAVLVAKQSGEALAEKLGNPLEHADYGEILTIAAFIFMCLSLIWYRSSLGRRSRVVTPLGHITALAGIAVLVLTFLTGHTGAQAVWESKITALNSSTTSSAAPTTSEKKYSKADLAKHATAKSCWSAVDGDVYDLTKWAARHPGGEGVILGMCGRDASAAFNGQHEGGREPAEELAKYRIGSLA